MTLKVKPIKHPEDRGTYFLECNPLIKGNMRRVFRIMPGGRFLEFVYYNEWEQDGYLARFYGHALEAHDLEVVIW